MSPSAGSLDRLYHRAPRGVRAHDLEPMIAACWREGDPQDAFDVIHVARTNGKGSVVSTEALTRNGSTGEFRSTAVVDQDMTSVT